MSPVEEPTVECSVCGLNGTPPPSCNTCHGRAATQSRAFTLSEVRRNQSSEQNRYEGGVGPKPSPLVTGGIVVSLPENQS